MRIQPIKLLCTLILMGVPAYSVAEIHEKVQAALNWQLPLNNCNKPNFSKHQVVGDGGFISHTPTNSTEVSAGTPMIFEVDHYKIRRFARKKKRWENCVSEYKSNLLEHFATLKSSAQYGINKQQAEIIMGKLAQIQAVVISQDGKL